MMDRRLFSFLCLVFLATRTVDTAFSHSAHWKLDKIVQKDSGACCFHPSLKPTPVNACNNSTLSALLDAHVANDRGPGLSIAYYDVKDRSVLGGVAWADWDAVVLPVGVCLSGAVDSLANAYSTTCRFSVTDGDHDIPSAHIAKCTISRPQMRVTDGCYSSPPPLARFRLDDSARGILTIISLIIALPSIIFGAYRWYGARRSFALQQVPIDDGHALPLVPVPEHDGEPASPNSSRQDPSRITRASFRVGH